MLGDEISTLCKTCDLGFEVSVENNVFTFDLLSPNDKRLEAKFSKEYRNLSDYEYEKDGLTEVNTVYNNVDGVITEFHSTIKTGLERREGITDFSGTTDEIQTEINGYLKRKRHKGNHFGTDKPPFKIQNRLEFG